MGYPMYLYEYKHANPCLFFNVMDSHAVLLVTVLKSYIVKAGGLF